jgi:hypothetical protein
VSGVRSRAVPAARPRTRPPGHDTLAGGLRFLAELIAWVATPWALWPRSIPLAVGAVVLLIALPAVVSTPATGPAATARSRRPAA